MTIITANELNIPDIISIAEITWNETYKSIISKEQIDYMLQLFYTNEVLIQQMRNLSHHFWLLTEDARVIAYTHCIEDEKETNAVKISKLYVLPSHQGRGIGKLLLNHIENECSHLNKKRMILNVNRHNPAKEFYLKVGFEIIKKVDIPLGDFWLNDYVMEKKL